MFSRKVSLAVVAASVMSLTGCGAIFNGSRQTIQVQSSPAGAKVSTTPPTGDYTTPTTLNLQRKSSYSLKFEATGYSPATFEIQNHTRGGIVVLDVLLTGLIGVVIDAATGAWDALSPEAATVSLTKVGLVPGPDTITVGIRVGKVGDQDRLEVQSSVPGVLMQVDSTPKH